MSPPLLFKEYRCTCGKLLFRGALFCSAVEIKCKRCSAVLIFGDTPDTPYTFTFFVNVEDVIDDACGGVAMVGYERKELIGKPISNIFPLMRDAPAHAWMKDGDGRYYLEHNSLLLKDKSLSVESCFVPESGTGHTRYRVFNIVHRV